MERTKKQSRPITAAGRWIVTAHNLSKLIPDCESLTDYYEQWSTFDDDGENIEYVKNDIKTSVTAWLENSEPDEILSTLHPLKIDPKKHPILIHLQQVVDKKYHHYLQQNNRGIPAAFVRPMIPTFAMNRRQGSVVYLKEPIIKRCGTTKMIIRGMALLGRDIKTMYALSEIMHTRPVEYIRDDFVSFTTSYSEIANTIGISNPYCKTTRRAIFNSLERMRFCCIIFVDTKGRRSIGGVLSKMREIEEESTGEIRIYLDAQYVRLFESGFANLYGEALKTLYAMSEREIQAWMFIGNQKEFKQRGTFGGKTGHSILSVYDRMNLRMLEKDEKPIYQKRYEVRQLMNKLKERGVIRRFRITKDDKLKIISKGKLYDNDEKN